MFELITISLTNIIYIFCAFSLVIFIHEFGHFYIGKRCGIGVNEFSIGFGPKLFWFKDSSGVLWKFCLLPFGGFVKFEGDLDPSSLSQQKNSSIKNLNHFNNATILSRALTVSAGPLANFLLSIFLFSSIIMINGFSNDKPVIGHYHVNKEGSSDMYFKGSLMLHTLRSLIEDDVLWFEIIKGIATEFKYQTIDGLSIISYINEKSGKEFTEFFNQYLKNKRIPEFQYKFQKEGRNTTLLYRWEAIPNFDMPILINTGGKDFWIYPNMEWKEQDLGSFDKYDFKVRNDLFFIDIKKQ